MGLRHLILRNKQKPSENPVTMSLTGAYQFYVNMLTPKTTTFQGEPGTSKASGQSYDKAKLKVI
jgi:hypothetical protein